MTYTTLPLAPQRGLFLRLRAWLAFRRLARTADLDTLSDHMRRDIGIPRDGMTIRSQHDAMRYSG